MKKIFLSSLIVAYTSLLPGCDKNNEPAPIVVSQFAGNYKGSIIDTLADFHFDIKTDYVLGIESTTAAGQVKLVNSPISPDTALIFGNIFTIPKKITIDNNTNTRLEEFAAGIFTGPDHDTLRAVFNSNSYKATNGTIGLQYKRTCFFVKQ